MHRATGDYIDRVRRVRFAEESEEEDATRQPAAAAEAPGRRRQGVRPRQHLWEHPSPSAQELTVRCSSESGS